MEVIAMGSPQAENGDKSEEEWDTENEGNILNILSEGFNEDEMDQLVAVCGDGHQEQKHIEKDIIVEKSVLNEFSYPSDLREKLNYKRMQKESELGTVERTVFEENDNIMLTVQIQNETDNLDDNSEINDGVKLPCSSKEQFDILSLAESKHVTTSKTETANSINTYQKKSSKSPSYKQDVSSHLKLSSYDSRKSNLIENKSQIRKRQRTPPMRYSPSKKQRSRSPIQSMSSKRHSWSPIRKRFRSRSRSPYRRRKSPFREKLTKSYRRFRSRSTHRSFSNDRGRNSRSPSNRKRSISPRDHRVKYRRSRSRSSNRHSRQRSFEKRRRSISRSSDKIRQSRSRSLERIRRSKSLSQDRSRLSLSSNSCLSEGLSPENENTSQVKWLKRQIRVIENHLEEKRNHRKTALPEAETVSHKSDTDTDNLIIEVCSLINELKTKFDKKGSLIQDKNSSKCDGETLFKPEKVFLDVDGVPYPHIRGVDGEVFPLHMTPDGCIVLQHDLPVKVLNTSSLPVHSNGSEIPLTKDGKPATECLNFPRYGPSMERIRHENKLPRIIISYYPDRVPKTIVQKTGPYADVEEAEEELMCVAGREKEKALKNGELKGEGEVVLDIEQDRVSQVVRGEEEDSVSQVVRDEEDSVSKLVRDEEDSVSQVARDEEEDSVSKLVRDEEDSVSQVVRDEEEDSVSQVACDEKEDSVGKLVRDEEDTVSEVVRDEEVFIQVDKNVPKRKLEPTKSVLVERLNKLIRDLPTVPRDVIDRYCTEYSKKFCLTENKDDVDVRNCLSGVKKSAPARIIVPRKSRSSSKSLNKNATESTDGDTSSPDVTAINIDSTMNEAIKVFEVFEPVPKRFLLNCKHSSNVAQKDNSPFSKHYLKYTNETLADTQSGQQCRKKEGDKSKTVVGVQCDIINDNNVVHIDIFKELEERNKTNEYEMVLMEEVLRDYVDGAYKHLCECQPIIDRYERAQNDLLLELTTSKYKIEELSNKLTEAHDRNFVLSGMLRRVKTSTN